MLLCFDPLFLVDFSSVIYLCLMLPLSSGSGNLCSISCLLQIIIRQNKCFMQQSDKENFDFSFDNSICAYSIFNMKP
ncbi:hypothetical protein AQUCO_00201020v1 [Aquilegia coerulea]|uniref:Uncharacterized protein n=1 Tax=Aquilegia coerulea TaxID=218851 RepID=A0A2G5F5T2_AQUCA|nr:hypothetical protein AQUCO_00201020v1 [Aquilegia coerulea]